MHLRSSVDQLSKSWVVERAVELRRDPIIFFDILDGPKALLEITYVTNPGLHGVCSRIILKL